MLSGSIFKGMLSLTIPIMIMNVMQNMFNLIDMMVLGKFTNDTAVGAVGTCSVLISLCTGLFIGVSTGANVVVARCIGSKNKERTEKAIGTAILFSCIGGIILALVGVCFAEVFLRLINCPGSLLSEAVLYFRLYFIGAPMLLLYNFCASILRAGGDTKRPMYFLFIGGINEVMGGTLRGMGKPIIPTVSTLIFMCLIRFVWVYVIFPLCPTMTFLYLIWPIGWILSIITQLIAYFIAMPKLQKNQD